MPRSQEAIDRKNAKKRATRAAERAATASPLPIGISKTHPAYRRRYPSTVSLDTVQDRRDFLRQVVLNTPGASA